MKNVLTCSCIIFYLSNAFSQWEVQCSGVANNNGFVVDFEYFQDTLYATGLFTKLCGTNTGYAAKWDGTAWISVPELSTEGHAMEVIDDVLYFAKYQFANDSNYVVRYYGDFASVLGPGVFNEGGGSSFTPSLYDVIEHDGQVVVSGDFNKVGTKNISGIMRWTGTTWDSLGSGLTGYLPGAPPILYPHNMLSYDGSLYIVGNFSHAGGIEVNGIARWDGNNWFAMADGFDQAVYGVQEYAGQIYAGGQFTQSGSTPLNAIARWNGTEWESPGFSFSSEGTSDFTYVHSLKVMDGKLFMAGGFDQVLMEGGAIIPCGSVIAWDGDSIYTFGGGVNAFNTDLEALAQTESGYIFGGGAYGQGYIATWINAEPLAIIDNHHELHIFPNPVSDILYVSGLNNATQYAIMDIAGRTIVSAEIYHSSIDVEGLQQGIYQLIISNNNNGIYVTRFLKI